MQHILYLLYKLFSLIYIKLANYSKYFQSNVDETSIQILGFYMS